MPGSRVGFLGHPGSFSYLFHSQETVFLMLPSCLAKLPFGGEGHGEQGGGVNG